MAIGSGFGRWLMELAYEVTSTDKDLKTGRTYYTLKCRATGHERRWPRAELESRVQELTQIDALLKRLRPAFAAAREELSDSATI